MNEKNGSEKKNLNLKLKTFADLKRFKSRQLHKIVEKMRESNKKITEGELDKFSGLVKYGARRSLIKRADRSKSKQKEKIKDYANSKRAILKELKANGEINDKKYAKAMEDLRYKTAKKIYVKDLGTEDQEKPKNPKIQRTVNNVKNAAKAAWKGIVTGATMVAGVVAIPFVGLYEAAKAVGRGVKAIGRGGKVAALTAGKVAGNVKNQVQTAKSQVTREMYENASKKEKQEMMEKAYKQADKENAKREREAQRRENLHMDGEQQPIDHEEAKKNTFERANAEELSEEEVKQVYGEEK